MIKQKFEIKVALKHPNPTTTQNLDFRSLEGELKEAQAIFNRKHGYKKITEFKEISPKTITLILEISTEHGIDSPARELSSFSRALYNNFGWSKYSSVDNRVFKVIEFNEIVRSEEKGDTVIITSFETDKEKEEAGEILMEEYTDSTMTDEEMLKLVHFVVDFKEKGSNEAIEKRQGIIKKIKVLLKEVIE